MLSASTMFMRWPSGMMQDSFASQAWMKLARRGCVMPSGGSPDPSATDEVRVVIAFDLHDFVHEAFLIDNEGNFPVNPASPALLSSGSPPPWEISRASSATPTPSSSSLTQTQPAYASHRTSGHAPSQSTSHATRAYRLPVTSASSGAPPTPASPTRARSTSDLLSEHEKSRRVERESHATVYTIGRNGSHASLQAHAITGLSMEGPSSATDVSTSDGARELSMKES